MVNKRVFGALILFLLAFGFLNFAFVQYVGVPLSPVVITGYAVNTTGIVDIFIEAPPLDITIYSPENITYNFNKTDNYIVDLNVSADFDVEPVDGWKYSLYDLTHEVYIEQDTLFDPNSSVTGVRWGNLLTVFALWDGGIWANESVVFYINVSNSAPLLGAINGTISVCEGDQLTYEFDAVDVDEEDLVGDISPKNPFYLASLGRTGNTSSYNIISGILSKSDVGIHGETLSVVDPYEAVDSADTNITVIEINNPLVMTGLGAQTVWLEGDDSTFYHRMMVNDLEDGGTADGNFEFNLTWDGGQDFFDIGNNTGIMNYSPQVGQVGVYSLTVCALDNALASPHENISVCAPNSSDATSDCDTFSLTVTDENRAPEIVNYTPINDSISAEGTATTSFFAEVYDADGTIPDIDWYVSGVLTEHNENLSSDNFSYSFGCGVSGTREIMAVTSDGLLNDSQTWSVSVGLVACPEPAAGGGGGASKVYCMEDWFCDDWEVCQNAKRSFDARVLSPEDYVSTQEICTQKGYDERFCGFQLNTCHDLNLCNNTEPKVPRPPESRICYFTENPNCNDGITNCHDGACELLVDCGGPCNDCPTCSDRKQNQGEEDVDCGGPCPYACEPESPFRVLGNLLAILSILLVLIILFISYKLIILFKRRREEKDE